MFINNLLSLLSCGILATFFVSFAIMSFLNIFECEKYYEKFISLIFCIFLIVLTINLMESFFNIAVCFNQ